MILSHAVASIMAAARLFLRDPKAWDELDVTTDGFFRSFGAVFLILPLNIMSDLFALQLAQERPGLRDGMRDGDGYGVGEMAFSTLALGLEWVLFPVVAFLLLRLLGLTDSFVRYVVAHNWGRVVIELFSLPAILLYASGLVSGSVALDLLLVALGFSLYYRMQIARSALEVGWVLALGIALLEILFAIMFALGVSQFSSLWLGG